MAPSPLEALKQGYEKLKKQVGRRKKALEDRLANKERILDDDGEWLDNEANLVDEQRVLEDLEAASDYERSVSCLDTKRKAAWLLASFGRQTQLEETNALVTVPITQWFTRIA
ncbi:hypothetical protein B0H13DRAFT_2305606 [Mycena leptocephala]|nr:hypothetical protein B0H13DRAFT_2305606 [Mycena leptocephala]